MKDVPMSFVDHLEELRARDTDALTSDELRRYSRHLLLPEVGLEGQLRLKRARVLVAGAGGLGSPVALYLAAAGVGRLTLADFDAVDASNLQRQILYSTADVGRPKALAARARLLALAPALDVEAFVERLDAANAPDLVARHDLVVDCTDNFPTRYLLNDVCVRAGKPDVFGSVHRFEGQVTVWATKEGPCYRCLHPAPPPTSLIPNCAEGGVLGVLPGVVGALQAAEALKLLLGVGDPLTGRLLLFDALSMTMSTLTVRKAADCPSCSPSAARFPRPSPDACTPRPGAASPVIAPAALKERLDRGARLVLLDVREPQEHALCRIAGSILIPLHDLPARFADLEHDAEIVIYCKMGDRSARAVELLRSHGYKHVSGLEGGMLSWIRAIEPDLA